VFFEIKEVSKAGSGKMWNGLERFRKKQKDGRRQDDPFRKMLRHHKGFKVYILEYNE
jgi:hypothetical protein